MRIAIVTLDGFNELDSFIALGMLNRLRALGWRAEIAGSAPQLTSMNGVGISSQQPLEFANEAEVVLFGSGIKTREVAADAATLSRLKLDPTRQLIGAQCSGTLLMARLERMRDRHSKELVTSPTPKIARQHETSNRCREPADFSAMIVQSAHSGRGIGHGRREVVHRVGL